MALQVVLEHQLCREFAKFLSTNGVHDSASKVWMDLYQSGYFDLEVMTGYGNTFFAANQEKYQFGTIERGRFILEVIENSFPTMILQDAYFNNLTSLLRDRPQTAVPGQLVIGLGTGRCGSTTLAALLAHAEGVCATHENPPLIEWRPQRAQVEFHLRRFKMLLPVFATVFDAAHWWLPVLDQVVAEFPGTKVVGLHRDTEACIDSFERVKGREINHWAPSGNRLWQANFWDRAYPSYPLPLNAASDRNTVRRNLIRRYVEDYNRSLGDLAAAADSVMLLHTDDLGNPEAQRRLFAFLGLQGDPKDLHMNALGSVADGRQAHFRF